MIKGHGFFSRSSTDFSFFRRERMRDPSGYAKPPPAQFGFDKVAPFKRLHVYAYRGGSGDNFNADKSVFRHIHLQID
jgi:hypothetical protein